MLSASLYIIVCTARNRLRMRLRRLREPRYLAGAVVGVAYVYFSFFARLRTRRVGPARGRGAGPPAAVVAAMRSVGASLAGIALLVVGALAWVMPFNSGLLEFSQAE